MRDVILLLSHFIGDYALQPRVIAENKLKDWRMMVRHLLIVMMVLFAGASMLTNHQTALLFAFWNTLVHAFMDNVGWRIYHHYRSHDDIPNTQDYWYYFTLGADQAVHLSVLFYVANYLGM